MSNDDSQNPNIYDYNNSNNGQQTKSNSKSESSTLTSCSHFVLQVQLSHNNMVEVTFLNPTKFPQCPQKQLVHFSQRAHMFEIMRMGHPRVRTCASRPSQARNTLIYTLILSILSSIPNYLTQKIKNKVNQSISNIIDCHQGYWIDIHINSLKVSLQIPFTLFFLNFINYYDISPN